MSLETSKKILKIFGIIGIIFGVLGIILGIGALAGSSMLEDGAVIAVIGGLILLVSGIVDLLEGIFSVRAAKDTSKIQPAWIFALIGLIISVISLINGFTQDVTSGISGVFSVAISALVFVAANTIKKNA